MVQAIERFIKQAIVDKDASVSAGALVSAVHLYNQSSKEVVKRWVNEVQEAVNRPAGMVQYLALGLLYQIKQHDKMAVSKIIQTLARGNLLRSSYAYVMLIRYTFKIMEEEGGLDGFVCDFFLSDILSVGRIVVCMKSWRIACVIATRW